MTDIVEQIYKKYYEYREQYYYYYCDPVLELGEESWKMLKQAVGNQLSYYDYPQEYDSFMGMRVKVIEGKKYHLEVRCFIQNS